MVFDEDALLAGIFVHALAKGKASVTLIAQDVRGETVLSKTYEFTNRKAGWKFVTVSGKPFRSVSLVANFYEGSWNFFADMAIWLSLSDYEKNYAEQQACAAVNPNCATNFSGNGSLFFLAIMSMKFRWKPKFP